MQHKNTISKAFGYAAKGLIYFFLKERNGKIQIAAALFTVSAGLYFHIDETEWLAVLLCIAAVLSLEMCNSALEKLCDMLHGEFHPTVKIIKDVAAAAVLWTAFLSTVIGSLIFIPKIIALI